MQRKQLMKILFLYIYPVRVLDLDVLLDHAWEMFYIMKSQMTFYQHNIIFCLSF